MAAVHRPRLGGGFTLIELLVCIAILALLAGILIPTVGAARGNAHAARCRSVLREVGTATLLHVHEQRGRLPSLSHVRDENGASLSWTVTLSSYLGPNFLGRCPSRPDHPARITYGWNDFLTDPSGTGLPYSVCTTPAATLVAAEIGDAQIAEHFHFRGAARGRVTPAYYRTEVDLDTHGQRSNHLFADGHVEALSLSQVERRLQSSSSPFIIP
jgi:prepilin-type N-terminal cleavage/methylation domain-containing protein/prepilin-type processing-associated H-X9-DG protein